MQAVKIEGSFFDVVARMRDGRPLQAYVHGLACPIRVAGIALEDGSGKRWLVTYYPLASAQNEGAWAPAAKAITAYWAE